MEYSPISPAEGSHSVETDAQHIVTPGTFPPAAAGRIAAKLLNRHSPHEIAEAVEVLIDVLNLMGSDPDAEDDDPDEIAGDEGDVAWIDWQNTHRGKRTHNYAGSDHEDAEEDDAPEEDDGDSAVDDRPCDDPYMDLEPDCDAEHESLHNDVPMLPVFSLDHNAFTDQRISLGISNLMTSFVCKEVVSADSGDLHRHRRASGWPTPGTPV